MRTSIVALGILMAGVGCRGAVPARLVWEGPGRSSVDDAAVLAKSQPSVGPGVHAGAWGTSRDATFQLLATEAAEEPHEHVDHDLTVVLLEGRGELVVEDRRYELHAGDVVHIARGRVHHFHPGSGALVVGLAIFTPKMDERDFQPVPTPKHPK